MPEVLDNIEHRLIDSLKTVLAQSHRADFCVGYFSLRGWNKIAGLIDAFDGGTGRQARVLVGMTEAPEQELREEFGIQDVVPVDNKLKKQRETELAEAFRRQLNIGLPDDVSIRTLRHLVKQLRSGKVTVRLFVKHKLHAKLYLAEREDAFAPLIAYVGSSNLTAFGLSEQGELNLQETDNDVAVKLSRWFEDRWADSVDITDQLAQIIEDSWAADKLFSPYEVYLKIIYHLAFEAMEAPRHYTLPDEFESIVLPFQKDAILRVRHNLREEPTHPELHQLALLGDVVGMGKTLTATAVAKCYQLDHGGHCVVCCPVKLVEMWREHLRLYDITGEVVPYSQTGKLERPRGRCRLLILDESHNLRNRDTIAWGHIHKFIQDQECKVLLLSATPYNKHYEDLAAQLALALNEEADLGIRPEMYFKNHDEAIFASDYQASPRSLKAFSRSDHADDWRDLLKHFMIRRTRGFIIKNHAERDENGRPYLMLSSGERSYFPDRVPKTLAFPLDPDNPNDQYAMLYNSEVVSVIEKLTLPRYGLGDYVTDETIAAAPKEDAKLLENLGTGGRRLQGYCRSNLFKRLESCGHAFLLSLDRHILRNLVFVYALEHGKDLPIGTQDTAMLDPATSDADSDSDSQIRSMLVTEENGDNDVETHATDAKWDELLRRAETVYHAYDVKRKSSRPSVQFRWIASKYFIEELKRKLLEDAKALYEVRVKAGDWRPTEDAKAANLYDLLMGTEKKNKVLVFTQFADTALYLEKEMRRRGMKHVEAVTAASSNPADQVQRFSPESNHYTMKSDDEPIRVCIATEVLSEGQNCQDACVVVNYDLPWAIIRLIQRAGRVDRIAQNAPEIRIYSCLPADGVEQLISLRGRLRIRLKQNSEVIGTDEKFFEDEDSENQKVRNLYAGKLEDEDFDDEDIDIPSHALSLWNEALENTPGLEQRIQSLPDQVFATREETDKTGSIVYVRTADGYDCLMRVTPDGKRVSQSIVRILKKARCAPDEPAIETPSTHHTAVRMAVKEAVSESISGENVLGPKNSIRRRVYERLKDYCANLKRQTDLFSPQELKRVEAVINEIHKYQLQDTARNAIARALKEGILDAELADWCADMQHQERLCQVTDKPASVEPKLICSIGMYPKSERSSAHE